MAHLVVLSRVIILSIRVHINFTKPHAPKGNIQRYYVYKSSGLGPLELTSTQKTRGAVRQGELCTVLI